tara:strand:+ start:1344 stop:1535 length:192 start_codon:yes stop_codon:yes gene_type:complete
VKQKMINELIGKVCPTTIMLNIGAIGIGMSETENTLKIISYLVAIIWTTLRIIKELKEWKKKK